MREETKNQAYCVTDATGQVVGSSQESYWNAVEDSRDKVLLAARDYFKQCLSTLYGDEDVTKADVSYAGYRLQRGTCLPDNELNELNKRVEFAEERLRIHAEVFGEMELPAVAEMTNIYAWMRALNMTFAQLLDLQRDAESWRKMRKDSSRGGSAP